MHRSLLAVVVALVACAGVGIGLRGEYLAAKDRRDLHDLTLSSPWPREELLVPDVLPADRATGWLDRTGLGAAFDLPVGGGRVVPVVWQQHHPRPDGRLEDGVDCGAVVVVTCTELGDGYLFAVTHQTHNSTPSTALYRFADDRVLSVTVQVPEHVGAEELRPALARTHRPTDDELLDLLRHSGYRTDWS